MKTCNKKKRLQIYLDGWMDERESVRFERHLRRCEDCQNELIEIEEISSAASEIIDHAPDRDYWESFFARVHNRLTARGVSPYTEGKGKSFNIKIASYAAGLMAVAAAVILAFNLLSQDDEGSIASRQPVIMETAPEIVSSRVGPDELNMAPSDNIKGTEGSLVERDGPSTALTEKQTAKPVSSVNSSSVQEQSDTKNSPELADSEVPDDYLSAFEGSIKINSARLTLNEDDNYIDRLLATYGGFAGSDYSVNPKVVAEGILTGRSVTSGARSRISYGDLISGAGEVVNPGWGYLGLPGDTTVTDEYRRYLIELDLMQAK